MKRDERFPADSRSANLAERVCRKKCRRHEIFIDKKIVSLAREEGNEMCLATINISPLCGCFPDRTPESGLNETNSDGTLASRRQENFRLSGTRSGPERRRVSIIQRLTSVPSFAKW